MQSFDINRSGNAWATPKKTFERQYALTLIQIFAENERI